MKNSGRMAFMARDGELTDGLRAAADGLPVYAGLRWPRTQDWQALLDSLPFLTRSDLRAHFPAGFLRPGSSFADSVASRQVELVRTSGTSSDRLQLLWDNGWWERQELDALRAHPAIRPHLDSPFREAVLTTPMCSESVCKTGPATMEERRVDNLLFLNTQYDPSRWTERDMARMADEIGEFQADAMEADPVYLAALARHIRDSGRTAPKLKWITLTYEFVAAGDKALIRSVFGCPVYEFYGLTEAGVFFLECDACRHHFCGSDSIVEILVTPGSGPYGEIVVTTWGNRSAPLVRYRTGDLAEVEPGVCACGLPGPTVRSFLGRIRDLMAFEDGAAHSARHVDRALAGTAGLAQYICVQTAPNGARVDYVLDGVDPGGEICARLARLWPNVDIRVKRVTFIPPEPSGKYRTIVPR